ncbi:hypothetical protein PENSTE_c002G03303 [Penicillium steckii]|uniref:SnoaL-like domain-containing protein n=1 Tax=Penicillium steckii TaxID=303698 RepID=A0A1V6TUL1_9EURO|nr:hypothetical protein PENSTE_c002G03303 [Penicillium steckii]
MTSRKALTNPVNALLQALTSSPSSIQNVLKTFTTNPAPLIYEHGLPQLAPFLGRPFTGVDGVRRYFEILGETLSIEKMTFEDEEAWVVDTSASAVVLRGNARFTWKGTGQAWDETFIYRIRLAVDLGGAPGELKVSEYRVWADTGAAYLARCGELSEVLKGDGDGILNEGGKIGSQDVLGGGLNVYGSCG